MDTDAEEDQVGGSFGLGTLSCFIRGYRLLAARRRIGFLIASLPMIARSLPVLILLLLTGKGLTLSRDIPPVRGTAVGDFDGDGVLDVAATIVVEDGEDGTERCLLRVYSGPERLCTLSATVASYGPDFWAVACVGDQDSDGGDDLVVGVSRGGDTGAVELRSGKTGALLRRWPVPDGDAVKRFVSMDSAGGSARPLLVLGWESCHVGYLGPGADAVEPRSSWAFTVHAFAVGDLDRDGERDVVIADPGATVEREGSGHLWFVSGRYLRTGERRPWLLELEGREEGEALGLWAGPAEDWDGDGTPDVFVAGPWIGAEEFPWRPPWRVRVFSGKDGSELWEFEGTAGNGAATSFAVVGRLDDDPHPEFAVSDAGGIVRVFSTKTGDPLWRAASPFEDQFGAELGAVPDMDGDDVPDLLHVVPAAGVGDRDGTDYLRILSGRTGKLIRSINPLREE